MPNPTNVLNHKWKKGQSGNPKGRPKNLPEITELLDKVLGKKEGGITRAEAILNNLIRIATSKDDKDRVRAAEVLFNRQFGMPTQRQEIEQIADPVPIFKTPDGELIYSN